MATLVCDARLGRQRRWQNQQLPPTDQASQAFTYGNLAAPSARPPTPAKPNCHRVQPAGGADQDRDSDQLALISADPDVMHGQAVIAGTRVPVSVILDNLPPA